MYNPVCICGGSPQGWKQFHPIAVGHWVDDSNILKCFSGKLFMVQYYGSKILRLSLITLALLLTSVSFETTHNKDILRALLRTWIFSKKCYQYQHFTAVQNGPLFAAPFWFIKSQWEEWGVLKMVLWRNMNVCVEWINSSYK